MRHARHALFWLILLWSFASAGPLRAQEDTSKDEARELFMQAGEAMKTGDYERAANLYAASNTRFAAPTAALGEARALVKLGRLLEARQRYDTIVSTDLPSDASPAFRGAVEDARTERELVAARIPALVITVEGEGQVSLDGMTLQASELGTKHEVDPGKHRITGPGVDRVVVADEGKVVEVLITIVDRTRTPSPSVEPDAPREQDDGAAQRIAGYALIGLGGAGLIAFAVTGGLYVKERGTVDDECDEQQLCSQAGLDAVDAAETLGTVNLVTLIVGIVAAGAGVTLVLTAPDGTDVEVSLGPTITGRF